jgi:hypothetical protein
MKLLNFPLQLIRMLYWKKLYKILFQWKTKGINIFISIYLTIINGGVKMKKIIVSIITIFVITSILAFAGCVEKKLSNPAATPSSTYTPKQMVLTSTVTPTPTPTATPTPKETVNVTLKVGYKWYQDDDLSYKIGYRENWQINEQGMSQIVVNNISGWQNVVIFESPSSAFNKPPEAHIMVFVYPNETLAKWWMQDYGNVTSEGSGIKISIKNDQNLGGLEKLKEGGAVTKYGNITINGREGYEVIYDPFMTGFGSKTHLSTIRMVVFDDASNNLYYSISVYASSMSEGGQYVDLYNKYNKTFDDVINSFVFPVSNTTAISSEAAGANKSMSPNITDIKLNVSRLTDENGDVKMIIATTNISIYNPTSVALILEKLNFQEIAMYKKNGDFRILKPLPIGEPIH